MRPIVVTVGPLATASANNIALSQTPAKGPLTLNGSLASGGVAKLDVPRQILLTTAANESTHTFIITGTDWAGSPISETITGANIGTTASILSYATVTSIVISANATGAVTVGTNTVASSPWVRFDDWASPVISKQVNVTGTVNYTIQQTMDDPNSPTNPVNPNAITWINDPDLQFVAVAIGGQGYYPYQPTFARILLNSGNGSVTMTVTQSGSVTY